MKIIRVWEVSQTFFLDALPHQRRYFFVLTRKLIESEFSEYYPKFPTYNKLDKEALLYDEKNKEQEKIFDERNPDLIFEKNSNPTIDGLSLFDALVFRNWLTFARMIGDNSYKKISDQIFQSKFVENQVKIKLNKN